MAGLRRQSNQDTALRGNLRRMQKQDISARHLPPKPQERCNCIMWNPFKCIPLLFFALTARREKLAGSLSSQLHTPAPAELFFPPITIPRNICCGRSQAFDCFQLQWCCSCIIHFLPAVRARDQHQTSTNTAHTASSIPGPLALPSLFSWSTFLLQVPLPAPRHLPNHSSLPWKAPVSLQLRAGLLSSFKRCGFSSSHCQLLP